MNELRTKARPRISAKEMKRRQEIVRRADANNRIEDFIRTAETDAIFEAYIRGDIEVTELVPRIRAQLGLR
jgi:hypothetical protein